MELVFLFSDYERGVCGRMALNLLLNGWSPMVIHSRDINLKTEHEHFNLMNAQIGPKVFHRPRDTGPWSLTEGVP